MNKVILMGRLTRDPEVRYSQGENSSAILCWISAFGSCIIYQELSGPRRYLAAIMLPSFCLYGLCAQRLEDRAVL